MRPPSTTTAGPRRSRSPTTSPSSSTACTTTSSRASSSPTTRSWSATSRARRPERRSSSRRHSRAASRRARSSRCCAVRPATDVAIDRSLRFICEVATPPHASARGPATARSRYHADPAGEPLARVVQDDRRPLRRHGSRCSGLLRDASTRPVLVNTRTKAEERLHVLQHLHGKNALATSARRVAGDIVAVPKLDDARAGRHARPEVDFRWSSRAASNAEPALSIAIKPEDHRRRGPADDRPAPPPGGGPRARGPPRR